jgi:Carboxypeptidase regulatory-like domain/TonB dependent receptor-like, beta-barrel
MKSFNLWRRSQLNLILLVVAFALPAVAFAQFSGSIQGTVTDPSGAIVPGATLQLINRDTGVVHTSQSGPDGVYHFVSLPPGRYEVKASAKGFSDVTVDIVLMTAQTFDLPISLKVLSSKQQVTVTSEAPVLNTSETRSQLTLNDTAIKTLPMGERSLFPLMTFVPGVQGLGTDLLSDIGSSTANFSPQITFDMSTNGRGPGGNMFVIDGLDVTSNICNGCINLTPTPDSIQEMSVQTNTFNVEYGRYTGLEVIMTTKSGTKQYHGNLSDYYTYQDLWAGTEFVHHYAPFHINDASGAIGGPIPIGHDFFFFASDELLRTLTATGNQSITYEAPQFVDFAKQNFPNTLGTQLLTSYPMGGVTTTSVAKTAADIFPTTCGTPTAANIPCSLPMVDSGIFNASDYLNGNQYHFRIDKNFSNDRVYGNFYYMDMHNGGPKARTGMETTNPHYASSLQINESHVFSPSVLNQAAFGYNRVEGNSNRTGPFHIPSISVVGMSTGIGVGFANGDFIQHNYRWRDVLNFLHGSHSLKFGYEGWTGDDLALFAPAYGQPSFTFTNLLNLVQDQPYSESNLSYDPLTGQPAKGQYGFAMSTNGVFAQDTWKVTHHLTLNYGLRWDEFGNPYPTYDTVLANFFLGPGQNFDQQVANGSMIQRGNVMNHAPMAFSPRLGVAWDPNGSTKWVVRGGFGVFHDWTALGSDENQLKGNPPGWVVPTFLTGTTEAPIFALGTSDTYPFGYPYPPFTATGLDSHGGLIGKLPSVGGLDPNLAAPNTYNYTVTLERALGRNFTASVGYSGSHSTGLLSGSDGNGEQSYGTDINHVAGDLVIHNDVLQRLNPSFGTIQYSFNQSSATYNALIVAVKGNLGKRGFISASYTRSSSWDNGSQYPMPILTNQYWGPSPYDAPNRFSMAESYFVPTLRPNNAFLNRLTGGWELSSTTALQSGYPFTVYTRAPFQPIFDAQGNVVGMQPGSGDYNADGHNYDFPNVPSTGYKQPTSRQAYLNGLFPASSFGIPAMGTEGNELSNRFSGPGFADIDFAVMKDNHIGERVGLQLRFEFYNLFNRPNLSGMVSDLSSSSFGRTTSQLNPRWLQLSASITF